MIRRATTAHLAMLSCAALIFLFCEGKELAMNDLGIYLAQAREMVAAGHFVDVDHFTHTVTGTRFLNGTWGSQLVLYGLWRLGGFTLLQTLLGVAATSAVLLTAWGGKRAAGDLRPAGFAALLSAWLVLQNLGLRPQLFSLPCFAAYATIALTFRPSRWTAAASALIVAAWANLHGAFIIAPVLSLTVAFGCAWESLPATRDPKAIVAHFWRESIGATETRGHLLTAAVVLAASCVNPYGPGILFYVAENTSSPASRGLSEWQRTTLTGFPGIRLAIGAGALAWLCWKKRRLPARRDLPAILAFLFLALTAIRHVVWVGMIVPIAFARLWGKESDEPKRVPPPLAVGLAAMWTVFLVAQLPVVRLRGLSGDEEMKQTFDPKTPIALASWCAMHDVTGNLFNSMEWGSLLAWRLPSTAKLYVDVRIWIFPDDVWQEYLDVSDAKPGWEDTLDRRHVSWAILDRRFHAKLVPAMQKSARWEQAYADDLGLVFRRRAGAPAPQPGTTAAETH